jgi:hypothetical protein
VTGDPRDSNEWQPATSRPGEVFTPEGQVRSAGAFARGLAHSDPRLRAYRRSMWRTAIAFIAIGVAAVVVLALIL